MKFHYNHRSFISLLANERTFTTPGPSIPYTITPLTVIPLVCPTANIWSCPLDVTSLGARWLEDFPRVSSTYKLQCLQQINTFLNEF